MPRRRDRGLLAGDHHDPAGAAGARRLQRDADPGDLRPAAAPRVHDHRVRRDDRGPHQADAVVLRRHADDRDADVLHLRRALPSVRSARLADRAQPHRSDDLRGRSDAPAGVQPPARLPYRPPRARPGRHLVGVARARAARGRRDPRTRPGDAGHRDLGVQHDGVALPRMGRLGQTDQLRAEERTMAGRIDEMRQRYEAFDQGNIEEATANWADDIVWQGSNSTELPGGGEHQGKEQALQVLQQAVGAWDEFKLSADAFFEDGDTVVVLGHTEVRKSENSAQTPIVHIWRWQGDQIKRFQILTDTLQTAQLLGIA